MKGQDVIDKLYAKMREQGDPAPAAAAKTNGGVRVGHPTDEMVIEKCRYANNAAKFEALFDRGEVRLYHGGDESKADLGLLGILAFYTQDQAQLERLFSASALGRRSKWKDRHDYRQRTIEKALSELGEIYEWRLQEAHPLVSSLSSPLGKSDDNDTNDEPEIVWFAELGEPKERKYLIEQVGIKGYPIIVFGAGGVAKSFGVLSAGVAIASASGVEEWLGLRVLEHGYVLYLDFELDVEEQHRRVRDLCAGMGILIPQRLAYLSGLGISPAKAFEKTQEFVKEYEAKAVIIDSIGLALDGDMERGKDILAFYRAYVDPLRRLGATPFLVDHEGKLQTGEKHKNKSPIGSAYKAWAARNVLQFELDEYDKESSTLDIRVRQTKTNFTPVDPFGIRLTFEEKKVSITPRELPDSDLIEEERIPIKDRIKGALRSGPATNVELQKLTGAGDGTIRNKLSELMQEGEVVADEGRPKNYSLADEEVSLSSVPPKGGDSDDTSETASRPTAVAELFADPPKWLRLQIEAYHKNPEQHIQPLCAAVAAAVLEEPARATEVREDVERELGREE